MPRRILLSGVRAWACSAALAILGCSSSSAVSAGDAGTSDAGDTAADGALALDPAATQIEIAYDSEPPIQHDGGCWPDRTVIDYARDTHAASRHVCRDGVMTDASATISSEDAAKVENLLASLVVAAHPTCDGYDGIVISMTAQGGKGPAPRYVDRWNNCASNEGGPPNGTRVVPKLGTLYQLLHSLVP